MKTRRDTQHEALKIALGGLYPDKEQVQAILSKEDGTEKVILDLGAPTLCFGFRSTEDGHVW